MLITLIDHGLKKEKVKNLEKRNKEINYLIKTNKS
jgi:hypothetical protein